MSEQSNRWMWSEAVEALARAEKLHRQLFEPVQRGGMAAAWEPPADLIETDKEVVAILALKNLVLFPNTVMPITIGRPKSIAAAQQAVREQRQIGVLMQRDDSVAEPTAIDMHRVGTLANIVRYVTAPDGSHHVVCQGEKRFQVVE